MTARINERDAQVSVDARTWRFVLDVGRGTACVELDGARFTLRAQSWQQKRMLARFAHLGERFLEDQFLRSCLVDDEPPPADGVAREALVALARWINAPEGKFGLPLDQQLLACVTLQVCRALGSTPQAFAGVDATDVEMLWQAARMDAPGTEEAGTQNRIVVIPDGGAPSETRAGPNVAVPQVRQSGPRIVEPEAECLSAESHYVDEVALHKEALSPKTAPADPRPARVQERRGTAVRVETRRFRVRLGSYVERRVQGGVAGVPALDVSRAGGAERDPTVIPSAPAEQRPPLPLARPTVPSPWSTIGEEREAGKPEATRGLLASDGASWRQPPMGAAVIHPRASASLPADNEQLFEELAARLEQAAAEQGIDLEP